MLSASSSRLRATTSLLSLGNELSCEVVAALSVGVAIVSTGGYAYTFVTVATPPTSMQATNII